MTSLLTPEQINDLVRRIGDKELVARMTNCKDTSVVEQWIKGDQTPSPQETRRLLFIQKWRERIPDDLIFRLWLDGPVVKLQNRQSPITPVEAIRIDAFNEVDERARYVYSAISGTFGV